MQKIVGISVWFGLALAGGVAHAQSADDKPELRAAPPPDAKALAAGPKAPGAEPTLGGGDDGTTVTMTAGGLLVTGNSRTLALTGSGVLDSRFGKDGFGASLMGNYGQGAAPGSAIVATAQNIQGRIRYDRYVLDRASVFGIFTTRHDRFQGIDVRFNIDPGFKYLFVKEKGTALWGEIGYDLQHDIRRNEARVVLDANKQPLLDAAGQVVLLDKTRTDHSGRLFAGYRHAFATAVTLSMGAEYLQSVVDSTRWRMNFEALLAAKVGGGFAIGFGTNARYDHDPLPGKEELDTTTNVSLIYAFSDLPAAEEKKCPCPKEPPPPCTTPELPPPPPPATTAPATTPATPGENAPMPGTGGASGGTNVPSPATPPPLPGPAPTPTPTPSELQNTR